MSSFKKSFRRAILPASIIAAMAMSGSASAFKVETDNEDLDVRWDNTFRYNLGWRAQDAANYQQFSPAVGGSESKWKSGDMITNRLDVLSEFDFIYKKDTGFRISAAAWYDSVYGGSAPKPKSNGSAFLAGAQFPNGQWPNDVKRWYNGPSGEILDAFIFTKFDLGSVPVNVKLGQHTVYWGETLFSITNGIAVGQSPIDLRKAVATPGIEAKEVFLPINQFTFSAQVSPEFTIMGQYQLDFKYDRIMEGGTYFSAADFLWSTNAGNTGFGFPWNGNQGGAKHSAGAWGLAAKWRPEWLDGTAGFYFREYYPTAGRGLAIDFNNTFTTPAFASYIFDKELPRTKLYGLSLAKQLWGISFGTDISFKKDNAIGANAFSAYNTPGLPAFGFPAVPLTGWAPVADTWGFTQNMIAYDGKRNIPFTETNMWDSAVLLAEFEYGAIDKVTRNAGNAFQAGQVNTNLGIGGVGCNVKSKGGARNGCGTNDFYGINVLLEPKWFQVFPGTDITMPLFYGIGLHGNSFSYGPIEGAGSFSIGVTADVDAKYNFKLAYTGYMLKHTSYFQPNTAPTPPSSGQANAGLGDFSHKGNITFTAKASW
jgi:Protein of unknown function (DUF1302)